jgi:hypothetical protein
MTEPEATERMTPNPSTRHRLSPEFDRNTVSPTGALEVADDR